MSRYAAFIGVTVFALGIGRTAMGGYYSSFDTLEETQRYSRDYQVFAANLANLSAISAPKDPLAYVPIRQRYLLLEAMGGDSPTNLKTLGQKLDCSAVLIRRARYEDAIQLLAPLADAEENRENFLVLSHCASAHFLAPKDFQRKAKFYMKKAIARWPKRWEDVKDEQKRFLATRGWEETAFDRFRRYEVYFDRLIANRLEEDELRAQGKAVAEAVDPIFTEAKEKPVRFVNDKGVFEAGRIPKAEFDKLPKDAIEAVEQLLIWMPHDQRLLWLLGEVFNASAMETGLKEEQRNDAIRNAYKIFDKMTDPLNSVKYGLVEAKSRRDTLEEAVKNMRPPPMPDELKKILKKEQEENTPAPEQSWRPLIVAFLTGLALGLFTLWQYQEMRRRRQARA